MSDDMNDETIGDVFYDLVQSIQSIQSIVHQKTARTEPALHHFQRDFDAIRAICERHVGPHVSAG